METKILLFLCVVFCHAYSSTWSLLNGGIGDISLDQKIEVGTSTNVTCSGLREPYTSETLVLKVYVDGRVLSNSDVRAVNKTAVSVIVYGDTPGKRDVHCYGRKGEQEFLIGKTRVTVGFPPKPVDSLRCVSENMKSLKCKWTKPTNYVPTVYKATLVYEYSRHESLSDQSDTAEWSSNVFRMTENKFNIEIKGVNVFGVNTTSYEFSNSAIVIPDPVGNLKVSEDAGDLVVSWEIISKPLSHPMIMERFIWVHQLQYRTHHHWITALNKTSHVGLVRIRAHAHTNYTFRVRVRSSAAEYWSQPTYSTYQTQSKAPSQVPMMTQGSFTPHTGIRSQDITIFWKVIEEHEKNGPNFHYKATAYNHKTHIYKDASNSHLGAFAEFVNLDLDGQYTFSVSAVNSVGSSGASSFDLPSWKYLLKEPVDVQVFSYGNGSFDVSWKAPRELPLAYNYTIFYCANEHTTSSECNGTLGWDIVPSYQTTYQFHSSDNSLHYQYGVAINSNASSSGLVWASCTVTTNSLEKIRNVWVEDVTNTTMHVHWNLDCADKPRSIRINYCRSENQLCIGSVNSVDVPTHGKEEGILTGLEPFSTYKITIKANRWGNLGPESDAIYNRTDEGVPIDQPTKVEIEEVGADMMIVSWEPPNTSRGIIRRYVITVGKLSESTSETRIEFRGLSSYHTYEVNIAACTKNDRCGPTSDTVIAKTDVNAPGRMMSPEVDFVNSTHVKITWEKPDVPNGPISEIEVDMRHIRDNTLFDTKRITSKGTSIITNASDCQNEHNKVRYEFAVRAVNFDQENKRKTGNWSGTRTFDCVYLAVEPGLIIGVGVGGAVIVLFVFFVAFVFKRASVSKEKPPINLPSVLKGTGIIFLPNEKCERENERIGEKEIIGTHIEDFTTGFQSSDDGNNVRNTSAYSSTSSNDLLLDKRRNPSAESSGKSSSAMSLLTSSSQLSSDSRTDLQKVERVIELEEMKQGNYSSGSHLRRRTPSPVDGYVVAVPANSRSEDYAQDAKPDAQDVCPPHVYAQDACPTNSGYVYAQDVCPPNSGYVYAQDVCPPNSGYVYAKEISVNPFKEPISSPMRNVGRTGDSPYVRATTAHGEGASTSPVHP